MRLDHDRDPAEVRWCPVEAVEQLGEGEYAVRDRRGPAVVGELDGVGPATAQRIVAVRDGVGGFSSLEDLGMTMDLPGDVVERLRGRVVCLPR